MGRKKKGWGMWTVCEIHGQDVSAEREGSRGDEERKRERKFGKRRE